MARSLLSSMPAYEPLEQLYDEVGPGRRVRCVGERRCDGEFVVFDRFLQLNRATAHPRFGTVLSTSCPNCSKTSWLRLDA